VFLTNPLLEVQARALYVPFVKAPVIANMSWFTFVFFALVIVGSSNAVNLTDGLDGLATGCTITAAFAYALLSYAAGNFRIAEYLQVPFYPFAAELTVVCSALIGAGRSEEHTSELQSLRHLVCRLLLEKKTYTSTKSHSSII